MKLHVDEFMCQGHGRCYALAPEILSEDEGEGFVSIRGQTISVPEEHADAARRAAGACPEEAITLTDEA
jgi:ferredoxin